MAADLETEVAPKKTNHKPLVLALIVVLLALRYMVTAFRVLSGEPPVWVIPVYEVGTYLVIAGLLILLQYSLADYHIPPLATWIIILFRPLETLYYPLWLKGINSPMAFPGIPSLVIWVTAIGLVIGLRPHLFRSATVRRQDWIWILIGMGIGLATAIVMSFPLSLQMGSLSTLTKSSISYYLGQGLLAVPQQIGYAGVPEEPVFRAFLWGYLLKNGWRDFWIWGFQAVLFSLAHLYYLNTAPISFWLVVPVGGLVLGWLAWRSRSIASSMVAHGVLNGMGSTLAVLLAYFRG